MKKLRRWSEVEKQLFTPEQIRAARAEARRGILVEFHRFDDSGPWVVFVRGPRGTNVHAHGDTIAVARRRVRAELAAVAGRAKSAELWRRRGETMPAGAEELEAASVRRHGAKRRS